MLNKFLFILLLTSAIYLVIFFRSYLHLVLYVLFILIVVQIIMLCYILTCADLKDRLVKCYIY